MELKVGMRVRRKKGSGHWENLFDGNSGVIVKIFGTNMAQAAVETDNAVANHDLHNLEPIETFELGDKVSWCGVEGVVDVVKGEHIRVKFENQNMESFTSSGLFYSWHKEPSLVLVEKWKPRKVEMEMDFAETFFIPKDLKGKKLKITIEEIR